VEKYIRLVGITDCLINLNIIAKHVGLCVRHVNQCALIINIISVMTTLCNSWQLSCLVW